MRLITLILICIAAIAPRTLGHTFQDQTYGFSVEIPSDWKRVPDAKLKAFPINPPAGGNAIYLGAFSKAPGADLKPPYILIEARSPAFQLSRASWDDLIDKLNLVPIEPLISDGQFDYKRRYRGNGLSPAALDRVNGCIFVQGYTTGADGKEVFLYSVNFLGRDDMVRLNCFAPADQGERMLPVFERIVQSFSFEPGAEYEPPRVERSSYRFRRRGPIGAGVALVLGLIVWLGRRMLDD